MSHDLVNVTAMLHSNEQQRTDNDRHSQKPALQQKTTDDGETDDVIVHD